MQRKAPIVEFFMYLPNPSTQAGCDTKSILSKVLQGWIHSFLPTSVAMPRLKDLVCLTIYS